MNKREVLKIVDVCFHQFASSYRIEAKHKAIELIDKLQDAKGKNLPIHNVIVPFVCECENEHKWSNNTNELGDNYGSFIKGYRTAEQEMFTEDDMRNAYRHGTLVDHGTKEHFNKFYQKIKLKKNGKV